MLLENEGKKVLLHIEYLDNGLIGVMNYAFYLEEKFLGTMIIEKNYKDLYKVTAKNMNIIILATIIACTIILVLVYIILNKIMKPLEALYCAMKQVGKGKYEANIPVLGKDEIS